MARLDGASLENIRYICKWQAVYITQHSDNGEYDWAISFIAYKNNNTYTIDNQWDITNYNPSGEEGVLNYQVWSKSEVYTAQLVGDIINNMISEGYAVEFVHNDTLPIIPTVYVKNGYYIDGNLILDIVNTNEAEEISVTGTIAFTEEGFRQPIAYTTSIPKAKESQITIPTNGYVFDIGLKLK